MRILTRTFAVIFACALLFVAGCDSLNLDPPDELASDQVWQDEGLSKAFLNDIYSNTGWGYGDPMIAGLADEAKNTHGHGDAPMRLSNMSPTDRGTWDWDWEEVITKFLWSDVYGNARDLNMFISNVKGSEAIPASTRETLLGEAYFLRAFFYHNLMRLYGGVPYLTNTFELSGDMEQFRVPRNTFAETVNGIVADLDSAAARLPDDPRRPGSATRGAALALKSRVYLHAASDLFHDSPFSGSEAAPFVSYQGDDTQQELWQKSMDAAQAVIDMGKYSLVQTNSPEEYHELFTKGNPTGAIWSRFFSESAGEAHNQSLWVSPNGYNSWSGDTPTQEHVNAYEMADGSQFEWEGGDPRAADEPIDVENPYDDRDPRFYANIHFNGAEWRARPTGLQELDPRGVIQTGWYEDPDRDGLRAGLDTRESGIQNWNGTKTGYNLRKFVDRDINPNQEQSYNSWQFIRYAEVLLNKAEAAANLGQPGMAVQALNKVRGRVGMPPVPEDGGPNRTLMERIRQEREVELAFEEFRYFDVRRWKIAPSVYRDGNELGVHGVRIEGELDPDGELLVENRYNYKYNVFNADERNWNEKAYFLPIARDEMNRNPNLVQNPGY